MAEKFSKECSEDAGREFNEEDKEEHLTEDAARYLVARDDSSGKIVAFVDEVVSLIQSDRGACIPCPATIDTAKLFVCSLWIASSKRDGK